MSPVRLSLSVALSLGAAFVVAEALLGRLELLAREPHAAADFRVALGLIALVAYLAGAFAGAVRGAERTWDELAPAFVRPAEAVAARASVTGRVATPLLRRLGWIGAAVGLAIPLATNLGIDTWFLPELPPEAIAHRVLLGPLGWLSFRCGGVVWRESRRLAALGAGSLRVDLLDLRPLAPLARAGIRHALLGAGALSVLLVGLRDTSVAPGLPFVVALASLANLALSGLALWLALRGGHEAIAREKERANAAADGALRALRTPGAKHAAGALADALAWKRFVAGAPDWPIDFPTLRRFVLPLALPLASLAASAFLEVTLARLMPG
jgi:hypothetical protein